MSNRSGAYGTWCESRVVEACQRNGFPHAERRAKRGARDVGDVLLGPGLILEVKGRRSGGAPLGAPKPLELTTWMLEAEQERVNARAELCPLVVRRAGTQDAGQWFAYLPLRDLVYLFAGEAPDTVIAMAPVCLKLAHLLSILRTRGYGEPLDRSVRTP